MIIWKGKSLLDNKPIVVIATFNTDNKKTGDMIQTWILRSDIHPVEASQTGQDISVCGNCPHRGVADGKHAKGRSCYVLLHMGPSAVYNKYRRGKYKQFDVKAYKKLVKGRALRIGSYGDPMAVPSYVWRNLLKYHNKHTGYTHQWKNKNAYHYRDFLMASCDTPNEQTLAKGKLWRTFRVMPNNLPLLKNEILCPASIEAGRKKTCDNCKACNGSNNPNRANVAIYAHGGTAIYANSQRMLKSLAMI